MSAPYDPRNICCHRCWDIERRRRESEEPEDYWRNGRIEVRLIAAQEPVWIDHAGHIFCGAHIPYEFFELKEIHRGGACETCGAEAQPIDSFLGLAFFEDMFEAPSGRIFCSVAHVPPEELRTKSWVRVGPCEGCSRTIHTLGGRIWKDGKPPRLFCSPRCHIRFYDLRKQAARAHDKRRSCVVCGETFEPRQSNAVTCSSACRQKAYRQRQLAAPS